MMQLPRRSFLGSIFAAVFAAGMPRPAAGEWKVYHLNSDYVAARSLLEAQAFYIDFIGELVPIDAIDELAIDDFQGRCFLPLDDDPLPRAKIEIAPWIRKQLAAAPAEACYLFTDAE